MDFPVKSNGKHDLPGRRCNYCGVGSTRPEFVSFCVGVWQDYAGEVVDLSKTEVMMQLDWQGPTDSQGTGFGVFDETPAGSSRLEFCSTACLRRFFTDCVDHLESLIEETKAETTDGV